MDKNTLKKLLEEKKLSETLMKDEGFKNEAKKILKEEKVDINDEDLMKILKATEKVLSGDAKIEKEEDLDEVVGGTGVCKTIARGTIKTVCTAGGATGGTFLGAVAAVCSNLPLASFSEVNSYNGAASMLALFDAMNSTKLSTLVGCTEIGAIAGGVGGNKLGNLICKKLGLNE